MTNRERINGLEAKHPDCSEEGAKDIVAALLDDAESRGRADVQAQLDEAIGWVRRLVTENLEEFGPMFDGDTDAHSIGMKESAAWLSAYDARAAAKKGG